MFKSTGKPAANSQYKTPTSPCPRKDDGPKIKAATGGKRPPQAPGAGDTGVKTPAKGFKAPPTKPC